MNSNTASSAETRRISIHLWAGWLYWSRLVPVQQPVCFFSSYSRRQWSLYSDCWETSHCQNAKDLQKELINTDCDDEGIKQFSFLQNCLMYGWLYNLKRECTIIFNHIWIFLLSQKNNLCECTKCICYKFISDFKYSYKALLCSVLNSAVTGRISTWFSYSKHT